MFFVLFISVYASSTIKKDETSELLDSDHMNKNENPRLSKQIKDKNCTTFTQTKNKSKAIGDDFYIKNKIDLFCKSNIQKILLRPKVKLHNHFFKTTIPLNCINDYLNIQKKIFGASGKEQTKKLCHYVLRENLVQGCNFVIRKIYLCKGYKNILIKNSNFFNDDYTSLLALFFKSFIMLIFAEPKSERSFIFSNIENSLNFLLKTSLLSSKKECNNCKTSMNIIKCNSALNKHTFYCPTDKKREGLFKNKLFESPKISIDKYLLAVYKWVENMQEKNVLHNCEISKQAYQKIKKNCQKYCEFKINIDDNFKLGGKGIEVQVDESVICQGFLSDLPTNLSDDKPGLTWVLGIIKKTTQKMRILIIPDRKKETIEYVFKNNINEKSIVVTDGFASYPYAVDKINGIHHVVNHSIEFKNRDGYHTNNIENLWSLLKYEIKKRKGIKRTAIEFFIYEFSFRYNFLKIYDPENIREVFTNIVYYLLNN